VDAYLAILAAADGTAGNGVAPTAAHYSAIGVTGVTAGAGANLLGTVVDGLSGAAVDTAAEVQALADAVAGVMAGATGTTNEPALADLTALGITGATSTNLALIQAAIAATADDGSDVDSLTKLQTLVDGVLNNISSALATISGAAQSNNATSTSLAASVYASAAVTGVDSTNVAAINSVLDLASINGAAVDTTAEIQAIVDAYLAILGAADGSADGDTAPTAVQYAQIGVTGVITSEAVSLLGSVIDAKSGSDVNTVAAVQALADAVQAVLDYAAGVSVTAPTLSQLQLLGVTGLSSGEVLDGYLAGLVSGGIAAADSLAELQAVEVWVPRETKIGTVTEPSPGNGVTVNFVGVPGQAYRVSATSSLDGTVSWSQLGSTHTAHASTGTMTIVDPGAVPVTITTPDFSDTVLRRFYKFEIRIR